MLLRKSTFLLLGFVLAFHFCNAQIEVAHLSIKNFSRFGFGAFLNFSFPVSQADYVFVEGDVQYFKNADENEDAIILPVVAGYRYTLNQTGTGFYIAPNAGYSFGTSTITQLNKDGTPASDNDGNYLNLKVQGPAAGLEFGYLAEVSNILFNVGVRYEHVFSNAPSNVFSLRLAHSFTFGRRNND